MALRASFLNIVRSVSKAVSKIHAPWSRRKITLVDYCRIAERANPGDVLLSWTNGELSNIFMKGDWSHVGLYCGHRESPMQTVVEAQTKGVTKSILSEFVFNKDNVALIRPTRIAKSEREKAVDWAMSKVGVPYDFAFDTSEKAMYCSELVVKAYERSASGSLGIKPTVRFGVPVYYPSAFMEAVGNGWELVYMSGDG
jgi:uncharacterized protein YycO